MNGFIYQHFETGRFLQSCNTSLFTLTFPFLFVKEGVDHETVRQNLADRDYTICAISELTEKLEGDQSLILIERSMPVTRFENLKALAELIENVDGSSVFVEGGEDRDYSEFCWQKDQGYVWTARKTSVENTEAECQLYIEPKIEPGVYEVEFIIKFSNSEHTLHVEAEYTFDVLERKLPRYIDALRNPADTASNWFKHSQKAFDDFVYETFSV